MENDKTAKISINLSEGSMIIAGSEDFVAKNTKLIFDFIEKSSKAQQGFTAVTTQSQVANAENSPVETQPRELDDSLPPADDKYIKAGVYHIDSEDKTISILKNIPGNSKVEKTKNIALIVLFIRKTKISSKEIIPICEKHACYDSSNFAAVFKSEKVLMIKKGSGQSWTLELTKPGEEAAIKLLEEMGNDKK